MLNLIDYTNVYTIPYYIRPLYSLVPTVWMQRGYNVDTMWIQCRLIYITSFVSISRVSVIDCVTVCKAIGHEMFVNTNTMVC